MDERFIAALMEIGIVSYREQENLWDIAERCAETAGVAMAVGGAVWGAKGGTVVLPGGGTLSGAAAGALAGLFAGTVGCTMLNVSVRNELRALARDASF